MAKNMSRVSSTRALHEIETGLKSLTSGLKRLVNDLHKGTGNGAGRRRRPITQALRLQGRYMGLIRTLPARKKGRVMAIRAKQGVKEAIRLARELKP